MYVICPNSNIGNLLYYNEYELYVNTFSFYVSHVVACDAVDMPFPDILRKITSSSTGESQCTMFFAAHVLFWLFNSDSKIHIIHSFANWAFWYCNIV